MLRSLLAAMAACALVPATSMAATHTVAPGETLWGIAYANNLPTSTVAAANALSAHERLVAPPTPPTTRPPSRVPAPSGLPAAARVVAGTNLTTPAPGQAPPPPVTPAPSAP